MKWKTNLDKAAPAIEAARAIITEKFKEAISHASGVYEEDVEAVHDYRVALRRLWAALKVFEYLFDDKDELRQLLRKTRKLARRLGTVRDLDVMIEQLKTLKNSATEAEIQLLDLLIEDCKRKKKKRFARLVKFMKSLEAESFDHEFIRFFSSHSNQQNLRPNIGSEVF